MGSAEALTTTTFSVSGIETGVGPGESMFAGTAAGATSAGTWKADVLRTALSPNGTILGGSFSMTLLSAGGTTQVGGDFAHGGTITQTVAGLPCSNQKYLVSDSLENVVFGSTSGGTGTFLVTLIHYRTFVPFVGCVTYFASVKGAVTLSSG